MNILGIAGSLLGGGLLGAAGGSPLSAPLGALTSLARDLTGGAGGGAQSSGGFSIASLIEPLVADGRANTASVNQLGDVAQLAGTLFGA